MAGSTGTAALTAPRAGGAGPDRRPAGLVRRPAGLVRLSVGLVRLPLPVRVGWSRAAVAPPRVRSWSIHAFEVAIVDAGLAPGTPAHSAATALAVVSGSSIWLT